MSSSYARISRDKRDIGEIRADARKDVEKARNSNKNIVFGMCHHSVAEHVKVNLDVLRLSRLAVEALEEAIWNKTVDPIRFQLLQDIYRIMQ